MEGTCDVLPPVVQEFSPSHRIACHLPRAQLLAMQPVFEIGGRNDPSVAPQETTP
jgi:hypothetical protein